MKSELKKHIISFFQMNGLSMRGDACDFLTSTLISLEENEREEWLDRIVDNIQNQLKIPVIAKEHIVAAITESCRFDSDGDESLPTIISAFDVPQFYYDIGRKKFLPVLHRQKAELYDKPETKGTFYKHRYTLLLKRTLRNKLFCDTSQGSNKIKLFTVDSLLSSSKKMMDVVILGMISQLKENKYFLEDPSGIVEMNLSETISFALEIVESNSLSIWL